MPFGDKGSEKKFLFSFCTDHFRQINKGESFELLAKESGK